MEERKYLLGQGDKEKIMSLCLSQKLWLIQKFYNYMMYISLAYYDILMEYFTSKWWESYKKILFQQISCMNCLKLSQPFIWILIFYEILIGASMLGTHIIYLGTDLQHKIQWQFFVIFTVWKENSE